MRVRTSARRLRQRHAVGGALALAGLIVVAALAVGGGRRAAGGPVVDRPAGAVVPATFGRDVAPILYANCAACHRDGEAAPFPLLTYKDARKHAKQIADVTAKRVMPPWKAEHGFGDFQGERRLTDGQIDVFRRWAEQGCPEGDAADAPPVPQFAAGWRLGQPDLVVNMAEAFEVPAEGRDIYRCFMVPVKVPDGKFIRAAEYRPGTRSVVHHAVLTTLANAEAKARLAAAPEGSGPGFPSGLVAPGERLPGPMGFWVPGMDPLPLPDGYAMRWPDGCELMLQLHLHPGGKVESERSTVGFYLTDDPPRGRIKPVGILNPRVDIAPGDKAYRLAKSLTLKETVDAIGVFPHMHLLGRTAKATATLPDGTTKPLLSVPDWDFNWQGYYLYAKPVRLPAGTRVDCEWTFDNSADNPANPSTPPRRVQFGEQTTDEMGALVLDVIPAAGGRGGDAGAGPGMGR